MANDIHMRDSFAKNHGAVVLAGTENADVLTYPVPNEGFQQWASLDHYAQRVLAGRFHFNDSNILLNSTDMGTAISGSVVVTYPAAPGITHQINGIEWGYSSAVANGSNAGLEIEDGEGNIVRHIHDSSLDGQLRFNPPICNRFPNTALIVTLHGGGAGITAYLNVEHQYA